MADLPQPWYDYACLQDELSRRAELDSDTWGVEAALNHIAFSEPAGGPASSANIARARATGARRERSRARCRALRLAPILAHEELLEPRLLARSDLWAVRSRASPEEWDLLFGLAVGKTYAELAQVGGAKAAAQRVTATRLRAKLRAILI